MYKNNTGLVAANGNIFYVIASNVFTKTTDIVAKVFSKIENIDRKVAKSIE